MAGITPIERAILVDRTFGVNPPAERWLAVTATMPDDDTLGIEIDGAGYERQPVTFAPSTHGETESTNLAVFITNDRSLADAAGVEVWTAKSGDTRVHYAELTIASVIGGLDDAEDAVMEFTPGTVRYEFKRE